MKIMDILRGSAGKRAAAPSPKEALAEAKQPHASSAYIMGGVARHEASLNSELQHVELLISEAEAKAPGIVHAASLGLANSPEVSEYTQLTARLDALRQGAVFAKVYSQRYIWARHFITNLHMDNILRVFSLRVMPATNFVGHITADGLAALERVALDDVVAADDIDGWSTQMWCSALTKEAADAYIEDWRRCRSSELWKAVPDSHEEGKWRVASAPKLWVCADGGAFRSIQDTHCATAPRTGEYVSPGAVILTVRVRGGWLVLGACDYDCQEAEP